jgi:hypothetical protein
VFGDDESRLDREPIELLNVAPTPYHRIRWQDRAEGD